MSTYFEGPSDQSPPPAVVPLPTRLQAPLRALYLAALLMAVLPFAGVFPKLWPFEPALLLWRYGTYGTVTDIILGPALAAVLAVTVAGVLDDRRLQHGLSLLTGGVGIVLLLADAVFALDYLQVRAAAAQDLRGAIDSSSWRAMFIGAVTGAVLAMVAWIGLRSAATPPPGTIKKKGERVGLVIGKRAD